MNKKKRYKYYYLGSGPLVWRHPRLRLSPEGVVALCRNIFCFQLKKIFSVMEQTYIRSTTVPLMIPDYVNPPQSYADTATSSTIE